MNPKEAQIIRKRRIPKNPEEFRRTQANFGGTKMLPAPIPEPPFLVLEYSWSQSTLRIILLLLHFRRISQIQRKPRAKYKFPPWLLHDLMFPTLALARLDKYKFLPRLLHDLPRSKYNILPWFLHDLISKYKFLPWLLQDLMYSSILISGLCSQSPLLLLGWRSAAESRRAGVSGEQELQESRRAGVAGA